VAVRDAHGDDIAPAPWSDNYVELMPGESRVLTVTVPAKAVKGASVVLSGWNIAQKSLSLSSAK
jgi:exo-1,4-beta-D-glucosaminidase